MKLDKINTHIIELLQQDAKITNTTISKKVGISSPAVAERIKKMEDTGIIDSYKAFVCPKTLGYQLKAIITLKAFMGKLKPFLKKVQTFEEVINCYRITGNENIVMEVILKDQKHLESLIDQLIIYGETKTQIVLSKIVDQKAIQPL